MPSLTQVGIIFTRCANLTLGGGNATREMEHPRDQGLFHIVVIASAGLLLAASIIPLALDPVTDLVTIGIAVATVILMILTKIKHALPHTRRMRAVYDSVVVRFYASVRRSVSSCVRVT